MRRACAAATKLREDRRPATRSNETWAMDFVHDQLATGRKLRVLTIVDIFSRFSPALEPRFTFRGADIVEVLQRDGLPGGDPCRSRHRVRVERFGSVGAPTRCRAGLLSPPKVDGQCLHRSVQRSLPGRMSQRLLVPERCGCQGKVEDMRNYYNVEWPHRAIGNQLPILLHKHDDAASPPS